MHVKQCKSVKGFTSCHHNGVWAPTSVITKYCISSMKAVCTVQTPFIPINPTLSHEKQKPKDSSLLIVIKVLYYRNLKS
jgi:hypothetical protein